MIQTQPHQAIAAYATKFHEALGPVHSAASPLGAWILLALVAPFAVGNTRDELEDILGLPIDEASEFARQLIATHHPAIASAVAMWTAPYARNETLTAWLSSLPRNVMQGPIPTSAEADAWVKKATLGILR